MTALSLFIFLTMLFILGMAVDLMRYETRRTALQNSLDSAVLAASNLNIGSECETVIRDFIESAGFDPTVVAPTCNEEVLSQGVSSTPGNLVSRSTTASYDFDLNTIFMKLVGYDKLNGLAASAAEQRATPVEISLVLDISGSMRFDEFGATPSVITGENRINDLRDAVDGFLRKVLDVTCDQSGNNCVQSPSSAHITVNIVPYAGHVNPGPELFALMGGLPWHSWSHCVEVTDADFNTANLPSSSGLQVPHKMRWLISDLWMNWGWCPKDTSAIMPMENNYQTLSDYVRNIRLHDGTATHIGMKYGVALLNPTSRDEIAALASAGVVEKAFAARPADWDSEAMKIVVLMTDGKTTSQFRPKYLDPDWQDWTYTIIENGRPVFETLKTKVAQGMTPEDAVAELSDQDRAHWEAMAPILDQYGSTGSDFLPNDPAAVESFYPPASLYVDGSTTHDAAVNNGHITAMCNEAKKPVLADDGSLVRSDRITVFTIAFLAPKSARDLMAECASTPAHFYNIEGLNISRAFNSIASSIETLRLTQ
ncbi:MAG: Tad domain-containing protein [Pseudomonadota bacterium]